MKGYFALTRHQPDSQIACIVHAVFKLAHAIDLLDPFFLPLMLALEVVTPGRKKGSTVPRTAA
eukprot:scaffold89849_cov68-Attheya_sp.AAC.4